MFGVPKASIDKKSPLRQKSKIAVLACGYAGSVGALKAFGALEMGFRRMNLNRLWMLGGLRTRMWCVLGEADKAAKTAVKQKRPWKPMSPLQLSERYAFHHFTLRTKSFPMSSPASARIVLAQNV
jgi:hypothetical protein